LDDKLVCGDPSNTFSEFEPIPGIFIGYVRIIIIYEEFVFLKLT
jgi:hypothetical protein